MTEDVLPLLKLHPSAQGLSDEAAADIAGRMQLARFDSGQYVHRAGETLGAMFFVAQGRLKSTLVNAQGEEQFFSFLPRMSLATRGLLDQPSAPMLLVNGARDTQVPIDDLYLLMNHGTPKEAWVNPVGGHMGRSSDFTSPMIARQVVIPWIVRALQGQVPGARH